MSCQLLWNITPNVTVLHAAAACFHGRPLVDTQLQQALDAIVRPLSAVLRRGGAAPDRFWQLAPPLAQNHVGWQELAKLLVVKTLGSAARSPGWTSTIAAALRDLSKCVSHALPDLDQQLPLRVGPIRSQWEARGPGMLTIIQRLTEPELIVEQAKILLVHPICGGGGCADLSFNSIRWEAVLANPVPEIPEVVRLAWLVSQLNNDLPTHSENIRGQQLPLVSNLALLPVTLTAASEVDLVTFNDRTLYRALETWQLDPLGDRPELASTLLDWWTTYQNLRPKWRVALSSLDRMIASVAAENKK